MSKITLQSKTEIEFTLPNTMEFVKIDENRFEIKVKNELPKTWEEFCKTHPVEAKKEAYCSGNSPLFWFSTPNHRDKCTWPNKQYAEAALALCQLIQLRDCYNDGWIADWGKNNNETKYTIHFESGKILVESWTRFQMVLAFKTAELRDKFLENFKDLIEIAKPLL